jgi:hypothetical protein
VFVEELLYYQDIICSLLKIVLSLSDISLHRLYLIMVQFIIVGNRERIEEVVTYIYIYIYFYLSIYLVNITPFPRFVR